MHIAFAAWSQLAALAGLCTLLLTFAWWRHAPALRPGIAACALLALLAPVLGRTLLGADTVSPADVQVLHETNTLDLLRRFTEPWSRRPAVALLLGEGAGLAGLVAANRLLHVLAAALFTVLLRGMLGAWVPALWITALGFASGLGRVVGASAAWGPLMWVLSGLGGLGVASARTEAMPRWARWLGVGLVISVLPLVAVRQELWLLGAAGLLAALWPLALPPGKRAALSGSAARLLLRPLQAPLAAYLALIAAVVAATLWTDDAATHLTALLSSALGHQVDRLTVDALLPLLPTDLSFVSLPIVLSATTPVALVALFLLGAWRVVTVERRWGWLLVAVLSLFKVYWGVGHGHHFEQQRYVANLLPAVVVLAALGWRHLRSHLVAVDRPGQRGRWERDGKNAMIAGFLLLSLVDGRVGSDMTPWSRWPWGATLERDQQVSARLLWGATQAWPSCVLVTRAVTRIGASGRVAREALVRWGASWPAQVVPGGVTALPQAIEALSPPPRCALAVSSLACQTDGGVGCAQLGERPPLFEAQTMNLPYRHDHFGRVNGVSLDLKVWPLATALRPPRLRGAMPLGQPPTPALLGRP